MFESTESIVVYQQHGSSKELNLTKQKDLFIFYRIAQKTFPPKPFQPSWTARVHLTSLPTISQDIRIFLYKKSHY